MESTGDLTTLTLPTTLFAELQAAAAEEHRPAADVLQDAVKRYVREKRWQKIRAYGEAKARALDLTEADIPQLIAESRAEHRQGRA